MYKLGFIGCGNMATAIVNGAVASGFLKGEEICVFDVDTAKADSLKENLGVNVLDSASAVAENSYAVVLAVKPQVFPVVLPQIKDAVAKNDAAIISIGAGKTLNYIISFLEDFTPVVRVMPNINAKVGASMSAVCGNENVDDELMAFVEELCKSFTSSEATISESIASSLLTVPLTSSNALTAPIERTNSNKTNKILIFLIIIYLIHIKFNYRLFN
jgi:pyrroline-5-carboxylate reductase